MGRYAYTWDVGATADPAGNAGSVPLLAADMAETPRVLAVTTVIGGGTGKLRANRRRPQVMFEVLLSNPNGRMADSKWDQHPECAMWM